MGIFADLNKCFLFLEPPGPTIIPALKKCSDNDTHFELITGKIVFYLCISSFYEQIF
jgi:hypothetical protein